MTLLSHLDQWPGKCDVGLPMIGALLGHTQPQTTARYAHLVDDPLKQAMSMVGERISAAMSPKAAAEVVAIDPKG